MAKTKAATDRQSIKLTRASLDEHEGRIVIRGVLSPESLELLQIDDYQREVEPRQTIRMLADALDQGHLPDIDLGMRGTRTRDSGDTYYLQDPVFIIDGRQRVSATRLLLGDGKTPHLGAMVHLDTTPEWERARFRALNLGRTKLSRNVILRNDRLANPALDLLFRMGQDPNFVLFDRISWNQRMRSKDLLPALSFVKIVGDLFWRFGVSGRSNVDAITRDLAQHLEKHGEARMRGDIMTFFEFVNVVWGIRAVTHNEKAVHLRLGFLSTLAKFLSTFDIFWPKGRLGIDRDQRKKLQNFNLDDPYVVRLCAGQQGQTLLFRLMLDHYNSGRRTGRLVLRETIGDAAPTVTEEATGATAAAVATKDDGAGETPA